MKILVRAVVVAVVTVLGLATVAGPAQALVEDDRSWGAGSLDVMVIHVMLMGVDFDVVEPPELSEHIRTLRDRLSRALA